MRSIEDIQELTNDFVKIQSTVQETLIKKLWIPPHDFLFLLSSLVGVALGGKTIKFIKKEYSRSIYHKQTESRDKKLKIKFPQLQEWEKYVYRDKKQIIDHIASLPEKQQDMLFSSFDSLQEFRNRKNDQPIQDLSSTTKAELIWAIKANRKRSK